MFRSKQVDQELDEELREYLDRTVQQKIAAGMSPAEALRAARVEMGSMAAVKDAVRDVGWESLLQTLWQDVRYGIRVLRKNPGFTTVAVLTLALGTGANTAIFSLINAVMLRSLPVQNPGELVQLQRRDPEPGSRSFNNFTNPLWEQIRDRQDAFRGVFAWWHDRFDLAQGGAVQNAEGIFVSGSYFATLGIQPAAGRLLQPADDQRGCPAVAVLSYGFWQNRFGGTPSAVGSTLTLNHHPFQVIGVSAPGFFGLDVGNRFDAAIPICAAALFEGKESRLDQRNYWWLYVMGRLKPGAAPGVLKTRLEILSPRVFSGAVPQNMTPDNQREFVRQLLVTAPGSTGVSNMRRQFHEPLTILMGVVALVLLIACANIASLMLARGANRSKEIALRKALGASRPRLIRQLLTECLLLSAAGGLLGLLFARWGSTLLVRYMSTLRETAFLDLSLDGRVLVFTAAVAVLSGMLVGVVPALRSTRVSLMAAMKGSQVVGGAHRSHFRAGKWAVGFQVAMSLVLLVAAGLLLRSFDKLVTLDLGFDRSNVLLVNANLQAAQVPPEQRLATYEAIETRLRVFPGVISASHSTVTPISGSSWTDIILADSPGAPTGQKAGVYINYISPGYFQTLRTPLLAGRSFDASDTATSPPVAIINQTLAQKFFPNLDPIGRTFHSSGLPGEPTPAIQVVGVVKDSKYVLVGEDTHPTAFFPITQVSTRIWRTADRAQNFELRTAMRPGVLTRAVQEAVAGVNKQIPLEFHTLAEQVDDALVQERLLALLSAFFGALALLMACIGLYGALSYLVTQRRSEFGIRMAVGAPARSILRLVLRDFLIILVGGVAAGVCLSLATVTLLQSMLFGLAARDVGTLAGASMLLAGVALVACYIPARRATRVDPMVALRCE